MYKVYTMLRVSIIFASGENNILGVNNDLYVKIPKDLQYFRSITSDTYNSHPNVLVMGYNTWKSLLPMNFQIVPIL